MPANHGATPNWHPKPDLRLVPNQRITPQYPTPKTYEEIRNWLEDTNASALAEANQFVDPGVSEEAINDMALRVYEDVKGGYFPLAIAVQRQQARELGMTAFCYVEFADGGIETRAY